MMGLDRIAACALFAVSSLANPVQAAQTKSTESYVEDPTNEAFYAKYNSMNCGVAHVSLVTLCHGGGGGEVPFCFDQTLDITVPSTHSSHAVHYAHPWRSGEPHAIFALSCMSNGASRYLAVQSTNLGNCGHCEWRDVYTLKGEYLGSDGDPGRDLPVSFRHLAPGFLENAAEQGKIAINRNP